MTYTEENVRAGLRVKDGKRVFYLREEDKLTPAAKEWLRQEQIEVLPAASAAVGEYVTPDGAVFSRKPEHMTHLRENILVPKNHPRIRFRGMVDTLEAELLWAGSLAVRAGEARLAAELREVLQFVRELIPCDVLEKPVGDFRLCGLDAAQLREHSHFPQKYYGQPHFLPSDGDDPLLLALNRVRTVVRQAELAAYDAFHPTEYHKGREDILLALNRLSSLLWVLMIRKKSEGKS